MKERIKRIFARCEDLDCAVFLNGVEPHLDLSFFYVSGLSDGLFETGATVIHPDGSLNLVSSLLEEPSAKKCTDASLHIFKKPEEGEEIFRSLFKGMKRIGINSEELTHSGYEKLERWVPGAEFIDISHEVKEARAVKDPQEIALLKRSCEIASQVAKEITPFITVGMKEYELGAELSHLLQKKGATRPNFTLVSFGPNSAEPHYMGGDGVLMSGDFVLLDFGCVFGKYHSDITRTFVAGKASDRQKEIHRIVSEAQQIGLDIITAGLDAREVHAAVSAHIERTEYKGRFTHSTGHSLGLSTHDGLRLFDISYPLEENMVFTVEPGIYLPGFGGVRIEDDIVVTKGKPMMLTDAPRDLAEL